MSALAHVLIMRTDHFGDMLFTLPMATALKQAWPSCRVSVLASAANAAAARHHPYVDHVELDAQESKGSNLRGVIALARRIRSLACDATIIVHPTPRLAVAAFLARVPIRVGTAYRAYAFLLTHRVRQHRRSAAARHEAEFNLDLLEALGVHSNRPARALWRIDDEEAGTVDALLRAHDLAAKPFVVLNPGSGGSAMNWAPVQYAQLGRAIVAMGAPVVVTGGPKETALTREIVAGIGPGAVDLGRMLNLGELAALLARATVYVGSSTGPTHLAAAIGTAVVALYAPLRSTLPQRWRPLGDHVAIVQPNVGQVCPTCLHERCPFYHCMEKHLDVDAVAVTVRQFLTTSWRDTQHPTHSQR
jgi:ADP-heptose:LPS heptosyltransferase